MTVRTPHDHVVSTGLARQPRKNGERHRLGVMGGTFDPIHHGHLVAASEVADPLRARRGRLRPDRRALAEGRPRGVGRRGPLPDDRHRDGLEPPLQREPGRHRPPGPTYTYDTLVDIRDERGDDTELFFITGADALDQILTWRNSDKLFDLAHFVGCSRPGVEIDTPTIASLPQERVTLLEIPALSISSTACRGRVAEAEPVWYLVPDGVVQYIAKRGLYLP